MPKVPTKIYSEYKQVERLRNAVAREIAKRLAIDEEDVKRHNELEQQILAARAEQQMLVDKLMHEYHNGRR